MVMKFLLYLVLVLTSVAIRAQSAPGAVDSLIQVSRRLIGESKFEEALAVNLKAETLALSSVGRESVAFGYACDNKAKVLLYQGRVAEAEYWNLEAIAIRGKVLGTSHPDYAISLQNLAVLYTGMRDFGKAEPLFLEAKNIWEHALGPENEFSGWSAECLGGMYHSMNQLEKAELFYQDAARLRAKTMGEEHPYYAGILRSQAALCIQLGQYKKAETLYLQAKGIQEKALGRFNHEYAYTLDGLAVLYDDYLRDLNKAERYFLEVKDIREQLLGRNHPDFGWSLGNLGNFYWYHGKYPEAEVLFREAHELWARVHGRNHPSYVWSLHKLWAVHWSLGNHSLAAEYGREMAVLERKLLLLASHYLSSDELTGYISRFQDGLNEGFSFAWTHGDPEGVCFDQTLFYKGFLLNAISQFQALAVTDSASTAQYEALKNLERELASAYTRPIAEQAGVAALEDKVNTLEKELSRSVAGLGENLQQVTWQEIQLALQPDEAALEFIHFAYVNPKPTDSLLYAAIVIRPGQLSPVFIPLFEEKQVSALLRSTKASKPEQINAIYSGSLAEALGKLIWAPLEQALAGVKTVYFSPAGIIHRLNLGALPLPSSGEIAADRYHLVEMGSTRQLKIHSFRTESESAPLLFGGIQYDPDSLPEVVSSTPNIGKPIEQRGGKWTYLTWTDVEVSAIAGLMKDAGMTPHLHKALEASEEQFKIATRQPISPRIIHLATHGYFSPDPKNDPKSGEKSSVFTSSEHPMIRSGLILAGGNYAWQNGKTPASGIEDGILTAFEISQVNLHNTELVVLSACETGLGDIQGNEGVYGLQRAFKIAGARYLIMSLWQVPDFQTQELMTTFYAYWLEDHMNIPDAFRAAQKWMRNKYKAPFLWAGFVLVE